MLATFRHVQDFRHATTSLHDLLQPHVDRLVVCDPRKAALLKEGNKSDRSY